MNSVSIRFVKTRVISCPGGERRRTEIARCPPLIRSSLCWMSLLPVSILLLWKIFSTLSWRLKYRNIGILITDHNVQETLTITDRAYLLFEGKILFQGKPEDLATNKVVREKYLSNSFVLRKKDFQLIDEQKRAKEAEEDG